MEQSAVADRLRTAVEKWGSIRAFADRMDQREPRVRGSSYAMIHRYLSGEASPSIEFLNAAAEVLGVRTAWLTHDIGAMTAAEEAERSFFAHRAGDDFAWLDTRIAVGFPEIGLIPDGIRHLQIYPMVRAFKRDERTLEAAELLEAEPPDLDRVGNLLGDEYLLQPEVFSGDVAGDELQFYRYLRRHVVGPLLHPRLGTIDDEDATEMYPVTPDLFEYLTLVCVALRSAYQRSSLPILSARGQLLYSWATLDEQRRVAERRES